MQIRLDQTVERIDTGFGPTTIHKFVDKNLERINSFSKTYMMNFISDSTVRLYFDMFDSNNVTITYDFNNDIFYYDLCGQTSKVYGVVTHIEHIDRIIDKIEELYIKAYSRNER